MRCIKYNQYMKNEEQAIVLTADSKPYNFNGKDGISHKIRLNILGEIYSISSTEEQVKEFIPLVGKEVTVTLHFISPKENLRMKIISVSK